jgi:hypothetical protein
MKGNVVGQISWLKKTAAALDVLQRSLTDMMFLLSPPSWSMNLVTHSTK